MVMRERIHRRFAGNPLARNSLWMLFGSGVRLATQIAYFILVARALQASGYGIFVAVASLVGIFAPFSSLGSGYVMIKNVSRVPASLGVYLGNAFALTTLTSGLLFLAILAVSPSVLPASIPAWLIPLVAFSDLFFAVIAGVCIQVFVAFQELQWTAMLNILVGAFRLAAALVLNYLVAAPTPRAWGALYLLANAAGALLCAAIVFRRYGRPPFGFSREAAELAEGFHFSLTLSSQSTYNDIDKTMLSRMSGVEAAGNYAAAYRFCDAAFMPVSALLYASYARFFQHGERGVQGSYGFARKLVPVAAAYSLGAGMLLFALAPFIPRVLGVQYTAASGAVRWLCLLPFLKSLHYFGADALTGAGYQKIRSYVQVFVAVFNVLLNLILIPGFGWRGAAWASLASDGLMAALVWGIVYSRLRKTRPVGDAG
jgi:O-antigen/teichoic acid export membrane protein